jgi:hypothetical protein
MEMIFLRRNEHETPLVLSGSACGRAALHSELNTLSRTRIGARNSQLNKSAFSLGQLLATGLLDRTEVEHTLTVVATAIRPGAWEIELPHCWMPLPIDGRSVQDAPDRDDF